ncbi:uncharacterized protein EV420DRAFT_1623400 [Desarmillaria tabescens]|uniref:Uncharacterized protein n=1 Tax=Armillaria tabescens TaxID=1929756 RepID=A0AA39JB31_ARMTA|nr:uncharacterized protein EV420DRAFT_1623400 [Desarmillaria tabescens]KAK0437443.1 hypothetical protein EV420DRAFT_1623400 [Desarmillaria tabescens]
MHGTSKGPDDAQRSYSHAQKLRAGTTYGFHKTGRRGKVPWNRATALGNPSISDLVSSYMLGLHKHKVAKGETSTSARAIGPGILKQLYVHNHKHENWDNNHLSQGNWCRGNMRRLLQAIYLVVFTCLLCIDEVLNIQAHEVDLYNDEVDNTACVSITLPFHKNAQFGDIPPFVLRELPEHMAHLCPKPEVFLQLFRNNLWDLGITPYPYGTHSFRQWWMPWGGWSSDFSHMTIVKYLISSNDTLTLRRDEFFKLDRQVVKCWTCGRTCPCA